MTVNLRARRLEQTHAPGCQLPYPMGEHVLQRRAGGGVKFDLRSSECSEPRQVGAARSNPTEHQG